MQLSRQRELLNEVLLQVAFLEGQIAMLEGAKRRASMCQAFYRTFYIRESNIVPVSSNFLTQISCGIITKCRKTRAMQRDFTIVDSLALRQLRHFDDSGHSFAKIAIPCTILSLNQFVSFIYLTISSCGLTSWMYLSTIYYIYMLSLRRSFFPFIL